MPKRTDIKSILLIGSGPIVIGQACEFDYSGTQAIKALKEEGYKVILVNSNPATIMTDPDFADRTYIEPITADFIEKVIEIERPCAVLPTMGGQTALNCAIELDARGVFEKYGCELIGANIEAIKTAEDRDLFKRAMDEIGLDSAKSVVVHSLQEAKDCTKTIGFPMILRPSRTLGGTGGGIVYDQSELVEKVSRALSASPNNEVLVEKSLLGWKEIELEVMRDKNDNAVIICGIENFDPMGVHTGDSITVAPIQTLTDKEYQLLRDAAIKVIRRIGVETGGSNVQFALNPKTGDIIVIEMNPRVSRSSALASKATGFPIAKIAAKLAIGYTLDEIPNDITKLTPACFEPTIDYVVVKIPRFNFEKFPLADGQLGTQMKSVGEALSFGRNFSEALQKAMGSLELDSAGFDAIKLVNNLGKTEILNLCKKPSARRLWYVGEAFRVGYSVEDIFEATRIDHWFLTEVAAIINKESEIKQKGVSCLEPHFLAELKRSGFSDIRIAALLQVSEDSIREKRLENKIEPSFLSIDTCAAEFQANTPYMYSAYEKVSINVPRKDKTKESVLILGSGPNRIGQGIEFDYCCVQSVFGLREAGYESIMVNCNPETVSTDYDISDRLYFEPLTLESVLQIVKVEKPKGVIIQFGGQTPLKLASALEKNNVPILGTSVRSIDIAEDRKEFSQLINRLKLKQPDCAIATSIDDAVEEGKKLGFPILIRPSFVLGGRAMRIVYSESELRSYVEESVEVSNSRPVLIDRYLQNAIEVDVDAISDGSDVIITGVMEHIERAGIHSGDSSCVLPPFTLSKDIVRKLMDQTKKLAQALDVIGFINVQFAISESGEIFVLEANPRASRTVPFVSKATGIPWVKVATKVMLGKSLKAQGLIKEENKNYFDLPYFSIKACVFPFSKFPGVDTLLGPEMKSTGEVMGIANTFAEGFAKSQFAANIKLPKSGKIFISVMDKDKTEVVKLAQKLKQLGFELIATDGTANFLSNHGVKVERINKVMQGSPHIVDLLLAGKIDLVINTPEGQKTFLDSRSIRLVANEMGIPTYTTASAAVSVVEALESIKNRSLSVRALQDYNSAILCS